jgi:hypothetical protein
MTDNQLFWPSKDEIAKSKLDQYYMFELIHKMKDMIKLVALKVFYNNGVAKDPSMDLDDVVSYITWMVMPNAIQTYNPNRTTAPKTHIVNCLQMSRSHIPFHLFSRDTWKCKFKSCIGKNKKGKWFSSAVAYISHLENVHMEKELTDVKSEKKRKKIYNKYNTLITFVKNKSTGKTSRKPGHGARIDISDAYKDERNENEDDALSFLGNELGTEEKEPEVATEMLHTLQDCTEEVLEKLKGFKIKINLSKNKKRVRSKKILISKKRRFAYIDGYELAKKLILEDKSVLELSKYYGLSRANFYERVIKNNLVPKLRKTYINNRGYYE